MHTFKFLIFLNINFIPIGTHEFMDFRFAVYSFNGTWIGFERLSDHFFYCSSSSEASSIRPRWLKFGTSVEETHSCDLRRLLERSDVRIYEPYIVNKKAAPTDPEAEAKGLIGEADAFPENTDELFPIPVRNINYLDGSYVC